MNNRIKELRKYLKLTQAKFAEMIGLKATAIGLYESGDRNITEQTIMLLCSIFNVNEEWLRTGEGEMFKQEKEHSLNEFLKKRNATALEIEFMKIYFNLDENVRKKIISDFKKAVLEEEFSSHQSTENTDEELSAAEEPEAVPPEYENMSVEEIEKQADFWDSLYEKRQAEIELQKQDENLERKKQRNNRIS